MPHSRANPVKIAVATSHVPHRRRLQSSSYRRPTLAMAKPEREAEPVEWLARPPWRQRNENQARRTATKASASNRASENIGDCGLKPFAEKDLFR